MSEDDKKRPRLKIVDRREGRPRRFDIAIQSVYYYLSGGGVRCAVLLTTSFDLKDREKLACAIVPLTARPAIQISGNQESDEEQIEIIHHIPHKAEHVLIGQQSELKNINMIPNISANALGVGVGISGMGLTKQRAERQNFTISLIPKLSTPDGAPDCVQWKFQDENSKGIFYPSSTDLILVVERTDGSHINCFPFELRLEWKLRVDVHGQTERFKIARYVGKVNPHGGWCFHIKANYNPKVAQAALEAALDDNGNINKIPPGIGLDAAIPLAMKIADRFKDIEDGMTMEVD